MNRTRIAFYGFFIALAATAMSSCGPATADNNNTTEQEPDRDSANKTTYTVEKLYHEFKNPWGMVWLPDGRMLVTERAGEILVFKNDQFTGEKLAGVPKVLNKGQGGLLDITLHPDYARNKWIYISYAKPVKNGGTTAISRFKLDGNNIVELQTLFEAQPALEANHHYGSRIIFDKDNYMFFSVGERGTREKVWELSNDLGKIHRLKDDGKTPDDNPFVNQAGAKPSIWTYGHRNPQGLVYDAANNRIWSHEHGPRGGDELNLIEKGNNYGWSKTTYGINYDSTVISEFKEMEGVTNPVRYWVPSIAPCGLEIVTSDRYPDWKGNLLVGALSFEHIARVQLSGVKYIGEERLADKIGRVREVAQSPDGYIYAVTEHPGLLIKLVPNK
ncbi:MAG TPA: PQQ-dependent sugar dehydrogenase [Flavitalea sp.]|nr:PQQ-dependent sugar dehydrogenase [Flavitalea sp.]